MILKILKVYCPMKGYSPSILFTERAVRVVVYLRIIGAFSSTRNRLFLPDFLLFLTSRLRVPVDVNVPRKTEMTSPLRDRHRP